jgi:hypothetical protein
VLARGGVYYASGDAEDDRGLSRRARPAGRNHQRLIGSGAKGVHRCFEGRALLRGGGAIVAHDGHERLVDVTCAPGEHKAHAVRSALYKLTK